MEPNSSTFDYRGKFGASYHQARRLPAHAEEWIAAVRAEKIQGLINSGDRVLEYGVGYGWNLAALHCAEKVGFDLTPELKPIVEAKGIRFEDQEEALESSHYDAVVCHHALEHVPNPVSCLAGIRRLLGAEGRMLLYVPFEREKKFRRYRSVDKAHHLYSWTPNALRSLVERNEFQVISSWLQPFRFDRAAALFTWRCKGNATIYRLVRALGLLLAPEYEIALVAKRA